MISGSEAEVVNSVARFKSATKDQISKELGFSSGYVGFLCKYLVRKGYLAHANRHYSLTSAGIKTLLKEETPKIDRKLLEEIAGKVAREISGEIKRVVKGINIPTAAAETKKETEQRIKIKTDFSFPVDDESASLESNVEKIGAKLEKERSDIDKSVELFKKLQKRGKR